MSSHGSEMYHGSSRSNSAGPTDLAQEILVKIKQEPPDQQCSIDQPMSASPVERPPSSGWEHQRTRSYPRLKQSSSPDTAVCEVCQGEFLHPTMLLMHKLCHFNTNHVCYVCDSYFMHTDTMVLHMATIHRNLTVSSQNYKGETERAFSCTVCLQRFSSNKMLTKHQSIHARKDVSYGCKVCALDFVGYRAVIAHLNSPRHKDMKVKLQGIFICVDCRAIFPTRDSYAMHMMMRAQSETCEKLDDDSTPELTTPTSAHHAPLITNSLMENGVVSKIKETMTPEESNELVKAVCRNIAASTNKMQPVFSSPTLNNNGETPPPTGIVQPHEKTIPPLVRIDTEGPADVVDISREHREESTTPLNLTKSRPTFESILMEHRMLKPGGGFRCEQCGDVFLSQDTYAMHALLHTRDSRRIQVPTAFLKPIPVEVSRSPSCTTPSSSSMPTRASSAPVSTMPTASRNQWSCHICSVSLSSSTAMKIHMAEEHGEHEKQNKDASETKNAIVRDQMSRDDIDCTSTKSLDHVRIKRSASMEDLRGHDGLKRSKLQVSDDNQGTIQCPNCLESFTNMATLSIHQVRCTQNSCADWHMTVASKTAIQSQQNSKKQLKKTRTMLGCQICGWTTLIVGQYLQHMRQHMLADTCSVDGRPDSSLQDGVLDNHYSRTSGDHISPTADRLMDSDSTTHTDFAIRRSKRKPQTSSRAVRMSASPGSVIDEWSDDQSYRLGSTKAVDEHGCTTPENRGSHFHHGVVTTTDNHINMQQMKERKAALEDGELNLHGMNRSAGGGASDPSSSVGASMRPSTTCGQLPEDEQEDIDVVDYVLSQSHSLAMCKYCHIIYTDKTIYYLHMGLHNLNNPWQCNLCGKSCRDVHEFSSHVIHYR